jgi:hypothetical protein
MSGDERHVDSPDLRRLRFEEAKTRGVDSAFMALLA